MTSVSIRRITRTYWFFTSLLSVLIIVFSIPDLIKHPGAVTIMKHLGYPIYLLPFLGAMKILGIITILVPAFQKAKEWAFAGLAFDLLGAFFSHLSVGDSPDKWLIPLLALALVVGSYQAGVKRRKFASVTEHQLIKESK